MMFRSYLQPANAKPLRVDSLPATDVVDLLIDEVVTETTHDENTAPSFNTVAVLSGGGLENERLVMHSQANLATAQWMVEWLRERLSNPADGGTKAHIQV